MTIDSRSYAGSYSEADFWDKLITCVKMAGRELLELALQLYYTLQASHTPAWAKAVIVAALGYFISPVDVIPDVLPAIGYTDDLAVLVAAVATVATHITDEIKAKAAAQVRRWFD